MTPWAWMKFTIFLWLLRKTLKLSGWLLLAAMVIAAWPVTLVGGRRVRWRPGCAAGPRSGCTGPPPGSWSITAAWLAALEVRTPGWRPALLAPIRAWAHGWDHRAAAAFGHAFLLVAPVAVPAGLALGGVLWAWRIYAITTGLGGITASAPIIFDARQWNRQARTALGLTKAPGAVPLFARGGLIPVGGTIRAIGHKWRPVLALPAASCARHMVIVGATGSREDEPDDPAVGGLVHRHPGSASGPGGGTGRCWWCWTARAAATPAAKPTAPAACSTARAPAGSPSGPMRRGCACGTCRPTSWPCCCTR